MRIAVLVFLLASGLLFLRSLYFDHALSSDQTFFQLVYQGKTNPEYADYRVPALDAYLPFQLTNFLRQYIPDPVALYRLLLPLLVFCYLLSFYLLLRRVVHSAVISILVPLLTLIPRTALGSQYWGIIGIGHATHRAFIQPFLVAAFLLFYVLRNRRYALAILFFSLGLASALYPTQGVYFALILLVTYLLLQGWHWRTLIHCILFGFAFLLGSLPHLIPAAAVGLNIDQLDPRLIPAFNEALRYRFAYTFYPGSLWTYTRSIILDVFLLLIIAFLVFRWHRRLDARQRGWMHYSFAFFSSTLLVTFIVPLLQDGVSIVFNTRLLLFDQFGESKFAYLSLYVVLAIFLEFFWHTAPWKRSQKTLAVAGLVLLLAVTNLFMLQGVIKRVYPLYSTTPENIENFSSLCSWVSANIPRGEVLLAEDFDLRYCSGRKVWVSWKDGMVYLYAKPGEEFVGWYQRLRRQELAYESRDWQQLIQLAKKEELHFIILRKQEWGSLPQDEKPVYENPDFAVFDK